MTANAFSLPFGPREVYRYALRNKKISKKRRKSENRIPKSLFPHMSIVEEEYGFGLIRASISPGFHMDILKGGRLFEHHSDH